MTKINIGIRRVFTISFILLSVLAVFTVEKLYGDKYKNAQPYSCLVGISLPEVENPSHGELMEEIDSEKRNRDLNVIMKVAGNDDLQQCRDIEQLDSYGADVLVIAPIESDLVRKTLAGIKKPVIILENPDFADSGTVYMEYDNDFGSRVLAKMILNKNLIENGVVLLTGSEDDPVNNQRKKTFLESFTDEQKEKITILEAGKNRDEAERAMKYFLISRSDIKTVVALSAQTLYGSYLASVKLRNSDKEFYSMDTKSSIDKIANKEFHWVIYDSMAKKILDTAEEIHRGISVKNKITIGVLQ